MAPESEVAVRVENLERRFGDFTAVNRISFEVGKGEIFGFLGPNGAGKSTTIKMLCGLLLPSGGAGRVGRFDIWKEQEKIKENIGYMSQKFSLYEDLTVEENINFFSGIYRIPRQKRSERKEWVLKMAHLEEMRSARTGVLSQGWKQRLALGCAVLHEPEIVFLDEPTSGTDPISRRNFWSLIREMAQKGVTVFVTTHYMDEAENCHRMALIYKGSRVAMGTPLELKRDFMKEEVLELSVDHSEEWLDRLGVIEGVKETALFGNRLHVIARDASSVKSKIARLLEKEGVRDYICQKIEPSLEDVFVSVIESYDREERRA